MEDKDELFQSKEPAKIRLSDDEKIEYLKQIHKQLIKVLTLIENERKGIGTAKAYFGGFLFDINSADTMFGNKLMPVLVKLNGLYQDDAYITMPYKLVRNKIFESRGVVEGLLKDLGCLEFTDRKRA